MERVITRQYGQKLIVHFLGHYDQIHFKLYAAVDQGAGKHLDDLIALSPSAEELEQAARWSMTHDIWMDSGETCKRFWIIWDIKMSLNEFRNIFMENIFSFLWRQWSALGVLGEARSKDAWVIDPEALLVFTIEMGRYETRLFDEVMDWLAVNGYWIDLQRLKGTLRKQEEREGRLMGAAAAWLAVNSDDRKWKNLANLYKPLTPVEI